MKYLSCETKCRPLIVTKIGLKTYASVPISALKKESRRKFYWKSRNLVTSKDMICGIDAVIQSLFFPWSLGVFAQDRFYLKSWRQVEEILEEFLKVPSTSKHSQLLSSNKRKPMSSARKFNVFRSFFCVFSFVILFSKVCVPQVGPVSNLGVQLRGGIL